MKGRRQVGLQPVVPPHSTISWLTIEKKLSSSVNRHKQSSSFPFDTNDENFLRKVSEKVQSAGKTRWKHRHTHPHTDNHWIRAWKKKRNPLSPHQKFKHFNTEFELHILQWNDLESSRSRFGRAKDGSENQWKSSAGDDKWKFLLKYFGVNSGIDCHGEEKK